MTKSSYGKLFAANPRHTHPKRRSAKTVAGSVLMILLDIEKKTRTNTGPLLI